MLERVFKLLGVTLLFLYLSSYGCVFALNIRVKLAHSDFRNVFLVGRAILSCASPNAWSNNFSASLTESWSSNAWVCDIVGTKCFV